MITTLSDAPRTTYLLNLADTNWNVLVDADEKTIKVLESISIACGASPADVSISVVKAGTDYYLWNAVTVAANSKATIITDHHIRMNQTMKLRIKASAANQISAIAVTLEQMPVQSGRGIVGPGIA